VPVAPVDPVAPVAPVAPTPVAPVAPVGPLLSAATNAKADQTDVPLPILILFNVVSIPISPAFNTYVAEAH
jgi:hypothetical protein